MTTIVHTKRLYPTTAVTNDFFSLTIQFDKNHTTILMQLFIPVVRTKDIPNTYTYLSHFLPSVLRSKCFNDKNLPFDQEVKNTEIGHLFEHVLLEYLCFNKLASGYKDAIYSGNTRWDWRKNTWGSFTIHISSTYKEIPLFQNALEKTMIMMQNLLKNGSLFPSNYLPPVLAELYREPS